VQVIEQAPWYSPRRVRSHPVDLRPARWHSGLGALQGATDRLDSPPARPHRGHTHHDRIHIHYRRRAARSPRHRSRLRRMRGNVAGHWRRSSCWR
jgi:hypothetical protein